MTKGLIGRSQQLLGKLFSIRWTASIALFLSLDIATLLMLKNMSSAGIHIVGIDKVAHVLIFAALAILGGLSLRLDFKVSRPLALYTLNILVWTLYGVAIEVLQGMSGQRSASFWDGVADFVGATLGSWYAFSGKNEQQGR